jgi:inner membrane protein
MPTVISHAVAAVALMAAFPEQAVPRRLMFLGAACSMAPDLDVIGFRFGIQYGDLLGHRGLSHSFAFAAVLASLALLATLPRLGLHAHRGLVWLYLFLATASHGGLDALTDGGLGVAFFSPFNTTRYFFPLTPIPVSPIGAHFFADGGISVLFCEFVWVWLPSIAFAAIALTVRSLILHAPRGHEQGG